MSDPIIAALITAAIQLMIEAMKAATGQAVTLDDADRAIESATQSVAACRAAREAQKAAENKEPTP